MSNSSRDRRAQICLLFILTAFSTAQTPVPSPPSETTYRMKVSADEVSITFYASNAKGQPVNDLKLGEIDVFDNDQGPGKALSLQSLHSNAIRSAILVDTSGSVGAEITNSRTIVAHALESLMRLPADSAMLTNFGPYRTTVQQWTNNKAELAAAASVIRPFTSQGTSLYDALSSTCLYDIGLPKAEAARNLLLLITDGEDTTSHSTLKEAADLCQRSNTAIFVFLQKHGPTSSSAGEGVMRQLSEQTGGRLFQAAASEADLQNDLSGIETYLRNQYRLIYRPAHLVHDGSFHRLAIVGPTRVAAITAQSGFYAPTK